MKYSLKLMLGCALLSMAACSANPNRFKNESAEKSISKEEAALKEFPPLKLNEGDNALEILDQKNGIRSYHIGNLTLIHKQTPNNPVVSARLYLDGGVITSKKESEGLDNMSLAVAVNGGTKEYPKDKFNTILDSVGSSVYSFTGLDHSGYGLRTLSENIDVVWPLFVGSVMSPTFPIEEINLLKEQQLAAIASRKESPDSYLSEVAKELLFKSHPYQIKIEGNEKSVASFTREQMVVNQRKMLNSSPLLLVVVGNITFDNLVEKVKKSFSKIDSPKAKPVELDPFTFVPADALTVVERKLPTHYVLGYFSAPAMNHADYPAMLVATSYLRERLFEEVRTKRNLSYAVSAGISSQRQNYGYLYVTAVDVKTTMKVIFDQVAELKVLEIPKSDLEETVAVFITHYYRNLETNSDQVSFLAKYHLKTGGWVNSQKLLEEIKRVTPADIKRVSEKYFRDYRFAVVGENDVTPALFKGD